MRLGKYLGKSFETVTKQRNNVTATVPSYLVIELVTW